MNLVERIVIRHITAEEQKIPAWSKEKDRVVYVLPETLKSESETYERIPEENTHHIEEHGKARSPKKPHVPKVHKPEVPRALTPAPIKPPQPPKPPKPVPHLKPHEIKPPKVPEPPKHPRRWKVDKQPSYEK